MAPRPIAWVSTRASDGSHNLAPFSFFQALCGTPPLIMLSIGQRQGRPKDTLRNFQETGEFVILTQTVPLAGSEYSVVIGEIVCWHVAEGYLAPDGLIDSARLRPIARLARDEYTRFGEVFEMPRPKVQGAAPMFRQLWFSAAYWLTRPRWDTNITPPELVELIESNRLAPGRALDLGCGTGTNVIYLARHGWQAVGVDFVGRAVAMARGKAAAAGVRAEFHRADVTRLDFLAPPFDFVLDIGCFHSLPAARRAAYVEGLNRLTRPGGVFLCYAFKPESALGGVSVDDMRALLAATFNLTNLEHGSGIPSAWYTFARQ